MTKHLSIIFCMLFFSVTLNAQTETDSVIVDCDCDIIHPQFNGNNGNINQWIKENLRWPKNVDPESCIEGRVIVQFIVKTDGSVSDAKVVRGLGQGFDEEALRLVNSMPKWTPGKIWCKPADIKYTLPVVFRLE